MLNNLNRNDLETILKIVDTCMLSLKDGKIEVRYILTGLSKIFGANNAEFYPLNQRMDGVDWPSAIGLDEDKWGIEQYAQYYWRYDPLYKAEFNSSPVNLVFKTDDIIPYAQFTKLDYYRNYLQTDNWLSELDIRLCTGDYFWGTISLSRSPKQLLFNDTDVQKAKFLLPYLLNTFQSVHRFSDINEERQALKQCVESRQDGVILVDAEFRLLCCNTMARQFCSSLFGTNAEALSNNQTAGFSVPFQIIEDCKHLTSLFQNKGLRTTERIVNTQTGETYYLRYSLIDQAPQKISLPCFVINLNKLTTPDKNSEGIFTRGIEFSAREQTIIQYAAAGFTNKEIGKRLFISPFTVQNHLQKIFEKCEIRNRTQLANLMKYI